MNVENILKVANAIERAERERSGKHGVGFNMASYASSADLGWLDHVDNCGTIACIAGWACLVSGKARSPRGLLRMDEAYNDGIPGFAADWFEISDQQADALFVPATGNRLCDITPSQAVAVLRHLASTGNVDWSVAPTKDAA